MAIGEFFFYVSEFFFVFGALCFHLLLKAPNALDKALVNAVAVFYNTVNSSFLFFLDSFDSLFECLSVRTCVHRHHWMLRDLNVHVIDLLYDLLLDVILQLWVRV